MGLPLTRFNMSNDTKLRVSNGKLSVDKPANERVKKHGERQAKRRQGLPQSLPRGPSGLQRREEVFEEEKQDDRGQPNGCIQLCPWEPFECVDNHLVRCLSRVDSGDT